METPKASFKKIAVPYGVMLGLATIVLSVIVYVMGLSYERPWWQGAISFVIMIAITVYGLKAYKQANGGFLSLGEALKTGIGIALISGIIGAIFTYLFITVIEPEFTTKMLDQTAEQMLEQNPTMPEEQMEMALGITEKMMSPLIIIGMSIIGSIFFGFIISLIAALIMKTEKPPHLE